MSRQRATFGKQQRERDKQAKAKAKRERRHAGPPEEAGDETGVSPVPPSEESSEALMERIAELQLRFENAAIGFEEYEEQKAALLSRLPIE